MPHTPKFWVVPIFFLCLVLLAPFTLSQKPVTAESKASSITIPVPVEAPQFNELSQALAPENLPSVTEAIAQPVSPAPAPRRPSGLSLTIGSINLSVPLGKTRLDAQGRLAVPASPSAAAWYEAGPKLGAQGAALITGHLESKSFQPGVFYNLRQLSPGDRIEVGKPDGSVLVYTVSKLESYNQDETFPWSRVYRAAGPSALRLITCDGTYSKSLGRYTKNLVVYATLTGTENPAR